MLMTVLLLLMASHGTARLRPEQGPGRERRPNAKRRCSPLRYGTPCLMYGCRLEWIAVLRSVDMGVDDVQVLLLLNAACT